MLPRSPIHASRCGWGGRIRTFEYGIQSPAPYRLATPHRFPFHSVELEEAAFRSGPNHVAQTVSLYDGLRRPQAVCLSTDKPHGEEGATKRLALCSDVQCLTNMSTVHTG